MAEGLAGLQWGRWAESGPPMGLLNRPVLLPRPCLFVQGRCAQPGCMLELPGAVPRALPEQFKSESPEAYGSENR